VRGTAREPLRAVVLNVTGAGIRRISSFGDPSPGTAVGF
jgi:hypothetical protein